MANTFLRKTQSAIGVSPTTIDSYTVGASTETTLIGLTVASILGTAISVDVMLNDGATDFYIVKNAPVPAGGALVAVGGDQKIVMETSDSIKVVSNTAASCDVIMSLLEIT